MKQSHDSVQPYNIAIIHKQAEAQVKKQHTKQTPTQNLHVDSTYTDGKKEPQTHTGMSQLKT